MQHILQCIARILMSLLKNENVDTTTTFGISMKLWYAIWCNKETRPLIRDIIRIVFQTGLYAEMDTITTTTAMPKKINADLAKKFRPITLQSEV